MGDVRLRFTERVEEETRCSIREALEAAGCHAGEAGCSPTILLARAGAEELAELVRSETSRARERVLVIVLDTRLLSVPDHIRLAALGAGDVLPWDDAGTCAERIARRVARWRAIDELVEGTSVKAKLLGESAAWKRVVRQVAEIAAFTDGSLLLMGETGTGKELLARLVHELDARDDKGELSSLYPSRPSSCASRKSRPTNALGGTTGNLRAFV